MSSNPAVDLLQPAEPSVLNAFSRGISFVLPSHIVRVGLLFSGWAIAARFVSPQDFGTFVLLTVAVDLLALVADFGLTSTIVRYLSANILDARRVAGAASGFLVATSLTICVVVYFWGGTLMGLMHASRKDLSLSIAVLFVCQYYQSGLSAFLQGLREYKRYAIVQLLEAGLRIVLVLLFVGQFRLGLNGLILAAACASAASVVTAYLLMPWPVFPTFDPVVLKPMLAFGTPLQVQSVMGFLFERTDVLMLGAMAGAPSVAAYDVAYKGPNQIRGLFSAFRSVFFPHLAGHYGEGQTVEAERFLRSTLRTASCLLAAATLVMALYGPAIVSFVFSPAYAQSGTVCAVLMVGISIGLCNFLMALALIASGRPQASLRAAIPEAVINIAANVLLIPRFGLLGAAAASVLSRSIANPIFLFQLSRTHAWPTAVCYLRSFFNLGVAYGCFLVLAPFGSWTRPFSLCLFALLSLRYAGLEWADVTFENAGVVRQSQQAA